MMEKEEKKTDEILDSDHDGLSDYDEVNLYLTDPNNPDTDGDGISDGDEVARGLNPNGSGKLVDFFVPHKGNNYKPDSLHPKRLAFHALAALIIKLLVFVFAVSFPIEAWLTPDVLREQSLKVIALTNEIRKTSGLNVLKENPRLAEAAFSKAQDMLINQYFDHVSPSKIGLSYWLSRVGYEFKAAGENLAMGFNDASEVVVAWTKSKTHNANLIDPDYTEIGVGVMSGPFAKEETTLVAQFFGEPDDSMAETTLVKETQTARNTIDNKTITVNPAKGTVAGTEIRTSVVVDNSAPEVDKNRSKVSVDNSQGPEKSIVRAEIYLSADTKKGEIYYADNRLELKRDETDINKWTATAIVFNDNKKDFNKPTILPSLTVEDFSGNAAKTDVRLDNVSPNGISLIDKYQFFREHKSKVMQSLFDITSFYYKMLLAFLAISLLLNIFIEIRKQHPHVIYSTIGLMVLLLALIII